MLFPFATEELVPEDEARATTSPYWADLTAVWSSAFNEWERIDERQRARLGETPNARPVVLNAFAQSFARERFERRENEGLIICKAIPQVFLFYIRPNLLLRFNGLGPDFVVRSTDRTPLKRAYFGQEPIRGLDNAATRLTVGYLANEAKTNLACVAISLQVGPDRVYYFRIDEGGEAVIPLPVPTTPLPPVPPTERISKRHPR